MRTRKKTEGNTAKPGSYLDIKQADRNRHCMGARKPDRPSKTNQVVAAMLLLA